MRICGDGPRFRLELAREHRRRVLVGAELVVVVVGGDLFPLVHLLVDAEGKDSRRIGVWNRVQARALREYGKAVTELAKNYEHTSNGCQSDSEEVAELRDLSMTQRR